MTLVDLFGVIVGLNLALSHFAHVDTFCLRGLDVAVVSSVSLVRVSSCRHGTGRRVLVVFVQRILAEDDDSRDDEKDASAAESSQHDVGWSYGHRIVGIFALHGQISRTC